MFWDATIAGAALSRLAQPESLMQLNLMTLPGLGQAEHKERSWRLPYSYILYSVTYIYIYVCV